MSTADAHVAEWEAILDREGLGAVDAENHMVRPQIVRSIGAGASAEAADEYLSWARGVLESCPFVTRGQGIPAPMTRRRIWSLHACGLSLNQIVADLSVTRRAVKVAIAVTKAEADETQPVANPWRCSGRAEEQRRIEEADVMEKRKQVEYARIILRESVEVPGIAHGKSVIVPVKGHGPAVRPLYGTPHAGGIDVEFDTEHVLRGQKRPTRTTITVPWWNIKKAEQVPEEVEPAA